MIGELIILEPITSSSYFGLIGQFQNFLFWLKKKKRECMGLVGRWETFNFTVVLPDVPFLPCSGTVAKVS